MREYLKTTTNRAKNKDNPFQARISPYRIFLLVLLVYVGIESC
jgi:hypothetical protein